ncbi:hypothetical protein D8B26_003101 [Coccidioides posadasii str. Silveira]|uniref:Uncharacterized protein n=3 Tax=Coccidioides posadasii TaxID=199306 RepID=E9CZ93_COCPS|nr:hypothetical protein CPC735_006870 [Coccidioides posadasii C735 delta SOWgp]EER26515.1 hypothetical protein CPC735_006870 [Coccidioides posadasii C735 delta SOWgp]EFW20537.1 conserved hypothetical protein [Coccidioides posadasii str. Silveira]KMM72898.1 hypothetical protein CPAG_09188 [Coccidioides posadasii RMSCC 3488]QVM08409.1 hypothetical protein D8B26_003101 [Coccidioides posadasii str. Silveira]|eukprot:XP_003068660.1 hypothetical protein CPC735_006870 [Coccidioides posadasii C735 delta SOWgp]
MAESDSEKGIKPRNPLMATITSPFKTVVSKPAQRAYLGTLFFLVTIFGLLVVSIVSYWVFYYNFVPQISLERVVHLQFGHGNPFGTAVIGPELAHSQAYDISVILCLPRSPVNLAEGNFMVDLALLEEPQDLVANISTPAIVRSRRSAILTYSSPLVETTRRVSRMPFYVFNWKREAEALTINMMERVEFPKDKKHIPRSLRLEIQSRERMHFYTATVRFDARFAGLRWLMYNWRVLSFVTFSSMFWLASVAATSAVWLGLNSVQQQTQIKPKIEKTDSEDDDVSIKEESDDEDHFRVPTTPRGKRAADTAKAIKEEEEIEGSAMIEPLAPETFGATAETGGASASTQSRRRSSLDTQEYGRLQQRKGRLPDDQDES